MFYGATSFNQPLNSWNVSHVTNMWGMFYGATSFNQPLNSWNVSHVTNMSSMFYGATSFNQPLNNWNISNVNYMIAMFDSSALSTQNYDSTLIGWNNLSSLQNNVTLGAQGIHYCQSENARHNLISTYNWTINDAGKLCSPSTLTINPISAGATTITGTGDPGATILITPNICSNTPITVDASGNWTCTVTPGSEPQEGDTITAIAHNASGDSAPVTYTIPLPQSTHHKKTRRLPPEQGAQIFGHTTTEQQNTASSEETTPTESNPLGGNLCPQNLLIHDFMKKGDRDGKYSSYNRGIVTEVKLLQSHINRLLKEDYGPQAAGPEDGIFGPLTKRGAMRLQRKLNELLKGVIKTLKVDGIVGPFTRAAINHLC